MDFTNVDDKFFKNIFKANRNSDSLTAAAYCRLVSDDDLSGVSISEVTFNANKYAKYGGDSLNVIIIDRNGNWDVSNTVTF